MIVVVLLVSLVLDVVVLVPRLLLEGLVDPALAVLTHGDVLLIRVLSLEFQSLDGVLVESPRLRTLFNPCHHLSSVLPSTLQHLLRSGHLHVPLPHVVLLQQQCVF